jgi:adsorption protein A
VHGRRLGVGLHWKPWRTQTVLFTVERQLPLDHAAGNRADTLLRASASWYGSDRLSDDWHPEGRGWFAQNIYVDAARYLRARQSVFTLDYQWGYFFKLRGSQTLEPYVRLQYDAVDRAYGGGFGRDFRTGIGARWDLWYGQTHYDAFPRRIRVGLEWQHAFTSYLHEKRAIFLTFSGQW